MDFPHAQHEEQDLPSTERRNLYPDTLFHFTTRHGLEGILRSNFRVAFSRERIYAGDEFREFGVPMVSFCDLRLSELTNHMDAYGKYGIGMSKNWAGKKGVNPVYYISRHASLVGEYFQALKDLFERRNPTDEVDLTGPYMTFLNFHRYMKNYEGTLHRRNQEPRENFRFADEREWRYVPPHRNDLTPLVPADWLDDAERKRSLKEAYGALVFDPADIRYIIVQHERERDDMLHRIAESKKHYPPQERHRLQSRILTAEQIYRDA